MTETQSRNLHAPSNQPSSMAMTPLADEELQELQLSLPEDKKLTMGRTYIKRKSKKRGKFWENFLEYIDDTNRFRAECKFCDATFADDPNVNGSKNISRHSEKCIRNPANKGKGKQTELMYKVGDGNNGGEEGDGKLKYGNVSLKDVREAVVFMIIIDELPFKHVENPGFRNLMEVACPRFQVMSRSTVTRDCLQVYKNEKVKLKDIFRTSCQRISITTDTWTSNQNLNYMCITAHFIDSGWKLHKRIINFCPISSHKGEAIGKAIESCLETWGIENKLFTVTVDNASSNDVACGYLRKMVQRTGSISDGKYLHVRCMAHIINLIVWDGIALQGTSIRRVRTAVKYIKNSPARWQRFKELAEKSNIVCGSILSLDCATRWNSTYTMLETALKYQRVFGGLNLPFWEGMPLDEMPPDVEDWKKVERLVVFLKGFYLLTRRISGTSYVTSNKGFFEIAATLDMLTKWGKNIDEDFRAMAVSMKLKYDKYWGQMEKMNLMIYVAVVLDPHSKFEVVELTLLDMHGYTKGKTLGDTVKKFIYLLFDEYRCMYATLNPQSGQNDDIASTRDEYDSGGETDYVKSLQDRAKRLKGSSGSIRSELERYLNEELGDEERDLDALSWWGINGHRYPIVSRMARDILAIPLSTVALESAFSAGGRHVNDFRSSLSPLTVQALICTQDWLRARKTPNYCRDIEENLREIQQIEEELKGCTFGEEDNVIYVVEP